MVVTVDPQPPAPQPPGPEPEPDTGRRLSPSRAADFKSCPLLFRFRVVDRLDEATTEAAVRGTVVHAALDGAFDLPPDARTPPAVRALLAPALDTLAGSDPAVADLLAELDRDAFLGHAGRLVDTWFDLEDPRRVEPVAREQHVRCTLEDGLVLRGIVDRLDRAADGSLRVVDYKTGRPPGPLSEGRAMFQTKFYALVLWRGTGEAPAEVQLTYLSTGEVLRQPVDVDALPRFERQMPALWAAVERAARTGDFRPNPGRACDWCDHRSRCPAWGSPAPDPPPEGLARLLSRP